MRLDKRMDDRELLLYGVITKGKLTLEEYLMKIEDSILGGVTILQLREKEMPNYNFLQLAKLVMRITDRHGIKLIINDNIEVCKELGCNGIHIGQDDIDAAEARKILGKDKIIGLSIQTMEHLDEASKKDIDYYGIGAVFPTDTKLDAADVPLDILKKISLNTELPVVAIGGINETNICRLEESNIDGIALVSAIYGGSSTFNDTKILRELVDRHI